MWTFVRENVLVQAPQSLVRETLIKLGDPQINPSLSQENFGEEITSEEAIFMIFYTHHCCLPSLGLEGHK